MKTVKHHLIGRSKRDEYNINDKRNLAVMDEKKERALHQLFGHLLTPHEQFEYINKLWLPIQSKIITELVQEINHTKERYADGLLKNE